MQTTFKALLIAGITIVYALGFDNFNGLWEEHIHSWLWSDAGDYWRHTVIGAVALLLVIPTGWFVVAMTINGWQKSARDKWALVLLMGFGLLACVPVIELAVTTFIDHGLSIESYHEAVRNRFALSPGENIIEKLYALLSVITLFAFGVTALVVSSVALICLAMLVPGSYLWSVLLVVRYQPKRNGEV